MLYSGYGITSDSAGSWIFNNDSTENVINANNHKKNSLVLGQSLTFAINGSLGSPNKIVSINFSKANIKFCLSLHYNANNSYLFVNEKEFFEIKVDNTNVEFPT